MYKTHNPLTLDCIMEGFTLKPVSHHPYLGVEVQKELKWKTHINNITSKANRTLGLIKRNLNRCSQEIKAKAYTTLVRPKLEYSSTLWDPYRKCQINQLEKIQSRAAQFVLHDYSRESSVTRMLTTLNWPTLQSRRNVARLSVFHKALHQIAISLPNYLKTSTHHTRSNGCHHFIHPSV